MSATPLLEISHLEYHFAVKSSPFGGRRGGDRVHAVADVSLDLAEGETLGLVGESGCGKTTLSRMILRLLEPTSGELRLNGVDISHAGSRGLKEARQQIQMVFQDPYASLNPRRRIGQVLATPLRLRGVSGKEVERETSRLLGEVGLTPEHASRFPHQLSGGQRQRVGIARALAMKPRLIVLDEPVSALDVSVQAQIVNLLDELQAELGLSYVFVAHDLGVVRHVSDKVAVMYLGKIMEVGPAHAVSTHPIHPYTAALHAAMTVPDPRRSRERARIVVSGEPPNPIDPPSGCVFRTRCPRASALCASEQPPLMQYENGQMAACHHPLDVSPAQIAAASVSPSSPRASSDVRPTADDRVDVTGPPVIGG